MNTMGHVEARESTPGNIEFTCRQKGNTITRSNSLGMFCDAEVCECEQKAQEYEKSAEYSMLKTLVDMFSK